ncbi:MAG: transposase [Rickettsiales bacterium]|nr:transposase [Rickettsiales bacterium]
MIKEWFTAREIAELKLTSTPKSIMGVSKKAKRENWKKRERLESGGGFEFHISNLPDKAQMEIFEKLVGKPELNAAPKYEPAQEKKTVTADQRKNARLIIVSLFNQFITKTGLGVLAAENPFLKLYEQEGSDKNSDVVPNWVYDIYPSFSIQSLRGWRSRAKSGNLKALGDKYGNRKGKGVLDRAENGEVANYIKALITHNRHLKAGHIRDLIRSKFGKSLTVYNSKKDTKEDKPLPNIRTFERFIATFKEDNEDVMLKMTDPDRYKSHYQMAVGKADEGIIRLNQVWEIDASPADVLCTDGRYNLYAIIDIYSRRSIFLVTRTPRTDAALSLIRKAILEWGVPDTIKTDNGADFISYQFKTALMGLGIEQNICSPFSPEKKPYVERVIGTLHRDLAPLLPGFIGHSVADRKKIEAKKAFSARLGEKDDKAFSVGLTAEELQINIDRWASTKYERRVHSSLGVSPFEKANNWKGAIKTIPNERALDLLLAPIANGKGYRKVTKEGIRVERGNFAAPELALYVGKTVFVRHDPADMGKIYVFDQEENYICTAKDVERLGLDRKELAKKAKAAQKEFIAGRTKEIKKAARSFKPEDFVNAYLSEAEQNAKDIIAFPKPSADHISHGLLQVEKALLKPLPPQKNEMNNRQQELHEELLKDLSQKNNQKPISAETRETRFERAMNLEKRLDDGVRVTQKDHDWLLGYKQTPEYRSQKAMREDFGANWFEEGGKL